MTEEDKSLYDKLIMLSKHQLRDISKGKMITISRLGQSVQIAMKGYSDEKAKVKQQIEKLKMRLKSLDKK